MTPDRSGQGAAAEAEIARLTRRLRDEPRSTVFVALADALRREGKYGEGLQVLREGFRVFPDHAPARVVLGRIHLEMGHRALAAEVLAEVVQADPENLAAASLLARIFVEDGRAAEARPLIERLRMANHPDAALRELLPPSVAPTNEPAPRGRDPFDHPTLAARFAQAGHYDRALAIWRRIGAQYPGSPAVREQIAGLERALHGAVDAPGEPALEAERRPLPGLAEAFAAHAADELGREPPRSTRRGPRRARHAWRALWRSPSELR